MRSIRRLGMSSGLRNAALAGNEVYVTTTDNTGNRVRVTTTDANGTQRYLTTRIS